MSARDDTATQFCGVIEGFYGPPWSWDARIEVCRFLTRFGANTYVYAPKSDPRHRDQWREPYEVDEIAGFERLVEDCGLRVGYAISPGLSMDLASSDDRASLIAKLESMRSIGIDWFCLALDDIPAGPDAARDQGALCAWIVDAIAPCELIFVPTDYTSTRPNAYLDGLAASVPESVAIGWTGPTVVTDRITVDDARARADALGGRVPWLWDNYPVNDGIMTERLFMGSLRGRDPELRSALAGYLANPMIQARASQLPLASALAWWQGDNADAIWSTVADEFGWTTFARACDGTHLRGLPNDQRREFLAAAAACTAPGIEDEVEPWLRQVHREAGCALALLDAMASDPPSIEHQLIALARWTRVPDAAISVFGPRRSLRPVLSQGDDVEFELASDALDFNENAIDHVVLETVAGANASRTRGTAGSSGGYPH